MSRARPPAESAAPIALASNRRTAAFERRVARALATHVPARVPVVVACSGGPDSLATLVAVVRSRSGGAVTAAHFDHRLRPPAEIARERALVASVAGALGARVAGGRAARVPDDRSESAAREARYRWLAVACARAGATVCVTGHTLDDQAETVLLRLTRGTGLRGAAGMEAAGAWPVVVRGAAPTLVRPLLGIARTEVEAYLQALGLQAARDPSNDSVDYARNRVRQRVLPELRAVNARVARQIAAFAASAREDDDALALWAESVLAEIGAVAGGEIRLERAALLQLPPAVASRVVRLAAGYLGRSLAREQVAAALHAARASGRRAALGEGVEAAREGASLVLRNPAANSSKSSRHPLALTGPGDIIFKLPRTGSKNT